MMPFGLEIGDGRANIANIVRMDSFGQTWLVVSSNVTPCATLCRDPVGHEAVHT